MYFFSIAEGLRKKNNFLNFFYLSIYSRIAIRSDTCTMVAISLNIQQRVHPIIWTVNQLPFDSCLLAPINKPIGRCFIYRRK